ncbi:HD domain-containing protein [Comamonas odontotermitis]|nr:HD domain-containing protein [Comamonas odontotermitis]
MTIPDDLQRWQALCQQLAAQETGQDAAHDTSHLQRVWGNAQLLLQHYPQADALVVLTACYLHDVVNLPKNHPDRPQASCMAAERATTLLLAQGFPAQKLELVAHAIAAHSFSARIAPRTLEARIVQDADRLDALGPVGLARMFHIGGQLGRTLAHATDPLATERTLDDQQFTLDHIAAKLLQLPPTMQTEAGRQEAERRAQWITDFRQAFVQQWNAAPIAQAQS